MAFMAEHPDALIAVVVDATFGHRTTTRRYEFDEAIANNELVAPPAARRRARRRLRPSIANKVGATISPTSFQFTPVRLAVRRGSPHRWQARAAHRLGLRAAFPCGPVSRSAA
jgi:hypothetical protein